MGIREELINLLSNNEMAAIDAYNNYQEATGDMGMCWMLMEEFPDYVGSLSGDDIFDRALYRFWFGTDLDGGENSPGNPMRDYYRYDAYGNIETTDNPIWHIEPEIEEIVDYFMEYPENYDFDDEFGKLLSQIEG